MAFMDNGASHVSISGNVMPKLTDHTRLTRAPIALEGLSVGDALGGFFEGATRLPHAVAARTPPSAPWHYTDDTQMALSIMAILRQFGAINQEELARSFAEHYERSRGYGPATPYAARQDPARPELA